jgi:cysteine synthase A
MLKKTQIDSISVLMEAVHSALGLRNLVTHIEVILPKSGPPAIVEVNPRLAGDLMPELYRLVYGVDLYRVASHLALGLKPSASLLKPIAGTHGNAAILFSPPAKGKLQVSANPTEFLEHSDERFGLVFPEGRILDGGETNDHRPAYVVVVGPDRKQMIKRAKKTLSHAVITHT